MFSSFCSTALLHTVCSAAKAGKDVLEATSSSNEDDGEDENFGMDVVPTNSEERTRTERRREPQVPCTCKEKWSHFIMRYVHAPIRKFLLLVTHQAAIYPRIVVVSIAMLSIAVVITGLLTNFHFEGGEYEMWTPIGSRPEAHGKYLDTLRFGQGTPLPSSRRRELQERQEGWCKLPKENSASRPEPFIIHKQGRNVLTKEAVFRVFDVIDTIRSIPGYYEICAQRHYRRGGDCDNPLEEPPKRDCSMAGIGQFWGFNRTRFDQQVPSGMYIAAALTPETLEKYGARYDIKKIIGGPVYVNGTLVSSTAFMSIMRLPRVDETKDFELKIIDALLRLKKSWENDPNQEYRLEFATRRSYSDEVKRSITQDAPLLAGVFVIMSIFACIAFSKRDWVQSRSLLGFGAVVCVLFSVMTGYGILFIAGVPFTALTQVRIWCCVCSNHACRNSREGVCSQLIVFVLHLQVLPFIMCVSGVVCESNHACGKLCECGCSLFFVLH